MKLVDHWEKAWTWLSMQLIAVTLLWESIPEDAKDAMFSDEWQGRITFWLLMAAAIGRMIKQSKEPAQ